MSISALAFFIDIELVPERLGLGVTTVVAMTTLLLALDATAPKVSYVKAMDIYVGFCFFMVFAALMQSAMVSYLLGKSTKGLKTLEKRRNRREKRKQQLAASLNTTVQDGDLPCHLGKKHKMSKSCQMFYGQLAEKLDQVGAILFPVSFATFNFVYWIYYLNADTIHKDPSWQKVEL